MNTKSTSRSTAVTRTGAITFLAVSLLATAGAGCHRSKTYESTVQLTRVSTARRNENGRAVTLDVEFSYEDCPGTQVENVRGGEEFAACMAKHHVGEKVAIKLEHSWNEDGHYDWQVFQVADCPRPPDPNDEFSFATVRECEDWVVSGAKVGFNCNITPAKELLKKCPWFGRH